VAVVAVVVFAEADGVEELGPQVQAKLGERESEVLKDATLAAREALQNANASGDSRDMAEAMGALANVDTLTKKLKIVLRQRKKDYTDPMAHVRVNSDPKGEEISFPALGLKMNTETAVDPIDGTPGPVSITAEVMGADVARERQKLANEVNRETKGEMAKFGSVDKVLAKNGFGKGFGRMHTRPATADDKKENAEAEAKQDREQARALLRKSLKTRKSVKKAMATMFNLQKHRAQDRLDRQQERQADAKAREKLHLQRRQEMHSMFDRIRKQNFAFRRKFNLDGHKTVREADVANEAAKDAIGSEVDPLGKRAKRFDSKLDNALDSERSEAQKMLATAKQKTMSHAEKTATAKSAGVQARMNKMERKEARSQSPSEFESEKQMEQEMVARAAEATSQVEQMEMGEGIHELRDSLTK